MQKCTFKQSQKGHSSVAVKRCDEGISVLGRRPEHGARKSEIIVSASDRDTNNGIRMDPNSSERNTSESD